MYLLYYWLLFSAITAIIRPFHKNLKKLVDIVQNRPFIWDPIYIYINIFINSFKIINSLKICSL